MKKKKNIGMKILAFLALFATFASIVTVGIMSFLQPRTKAPVKKQAPALNIDYANIKTNNSNDKVKVLDIKNKETKKEVKTK